MKGAAITKYFLSNHWAITPTYLDTMKSAFDEWKSIEGGVVCETETDESTSHITNGVAVLSYSGSFHKKLSGLNALSGGISGESIINDLTTAVNDDSVKGIVLSLDTPGGTVDGVSDVVSAINAAKAVKPVVTYADGLLASAGVWLGSTSNAVVCNEMAQIGSIGVIMVHQEESKGAAKSDVTSTVLTAGKYKGDGNRYEPLSVEAKARLQDSLDYYYSLFVDHVASSRGMTVADCLSRAAEGRMFIGAQAVEAGLVDHIGNLETAINLALTLGGYNVKQELQDALAAMDSTELMASLKGHGALPESVGSAIDALVEDSEEITILKSEYDGLKSQLAETKQTQSDTIDAALSITAELDDLRTAFAELQTTTDADTAKSSIASQFEAVGYEASDELMASLLAMDDPSAIITATLDLHNTKMSLAENFKESTGLDEAPDASAAPTTIDEAVNRLMSAESLDIDAAIERAAELHPSLFNR